MVRTYRWAIVSACMAGLAACGPGGERASTGASGAATIAIDGSSTVFPIAEAVAEDFQAAQSGRIRVTVGESGTGAGFKKFCRNETAISDASRPISASEMADCKAAGVSFIELPISFDALTVVVHPSNPLTKISLTDLKKIWEPDAAGKITNWKQVNPSYPDLRLNLYAPGTASGTFDYFTEAVNGKSKAQRTDVTPSEDDNVLVQGVSLDPGGMAYFGLAYYTANKDKVKALAIDNGTATVAPSVEAVEKGEYTPLSRPIFIYVNAQRADDPRVAQFVTYWLENGAKYASEVGYVGLPAAIYEAGLARFQAKQTGTAFGGHNDVGASIAEIMQRPLVTELPESEQ